MRLRFFAGLVFLAGPACGGAEGDAVAVTPSPAPPPPPGPTVTVISSPPPPIVPFEIPNGFRGDFERPPIVATLGDRLVLIRRLRKCEHVSGPSGTVSIPRLGTGSYTAPGFGMTSCDPWMDALDRDGKPIWDSPTPLARHYATVLGDRLLATGPGGVVTYQIATGLKLDAVADPVIGREACVDAPNARVFVNDWDDRTRDAIVDLATMSVRPAGRERCPIAPFTACDEHTARACLESRDERRPPTAAVDGFYEAGTLRTATDEVLVGRRTRGRKLPMMVAIDPRTHARRWSVVVPPADTQASAAEDELFPHRNVDIADGKLYVEYDAWKSHPHLAAFDMKDGARIWDVAIDSFASFTPTTDRVYLNSQEGMRVLDAKTGAP